MAHNTSTRRKNRVLVSSGK